MEQCSNEHINADLIKPKPQKKIVVITDNLDPWYDAKTNWLNINAFNKEPLQRRDTSTIDTDAVHLKEILEKVFLTNLKSIDSDESFMGTNINGYFMQHLLIAHEMYCNLCFKNNCTLELPEHPDSDNPPLCSNNDKGTQTATKIATRNISAKKLKPRRKLLTSISRNRLAKTLSKTRTIVERKIPVKLTRSVVRNLRSAREKVSSDTEDKNIDDIDGVNDTNNNNQDIEPSENDFQDNVDSPESTPVNTDDEVTDGEQKTNSGKRYEFKCKLCDKAYSRPGVLKVHVDTRHMGKKFKCEICKREYTQAASLRYHMVVHTEGPVHCSECNKSFMTAQNLKYHLKNYHAPKKEVYKCHICENVFSSKLSLKNHAVVHTEEKKFVCEQCGKAFKRKNGLTSHLVIHTGEKAYSCDICQATFLHSSLVYKHKKKKHGERDQLCNICGKNFFTVELLNRHTRTHSEEPHFKCRECGKAYRSETAYRVHLNTHKGILPKPQSRRPRKKPQPHTSDVDKNKQTLTDANVESCMFSEAEQVAAVVISTEREANTSAVRPQPFQPHPAHPSYVHYDYEDYRYF